MTRKKQRRSKKKVEVSLREISSSNESNDASKINQSSYVVHDSDTDSDIEPSIELAEIDRKLQAIDRQVNRRRTAVTTLEQFTDVTVPLPTKNVSIPPRIILMSFAMFVCTLSVLGFFVSLILTSLTISNDLGRIASAIDRVGIENYKNGECVLNEKLFTQTWLRCVPCSSDRRKRFVRSSENCVAFCGVRATFRRDIYAVVSVGSSNDDDRVKFPAYCETVVENTESTKANCAGGLGSRLPCLIPVGRRASTTNIDTETQHDTVDRTENDVYLTQGFAILSLQLEDIGLNQSEIMMASWIPTAGLVVITIVLSVVACLKTRDPQIYNYDRSVTTDSSFCSPIVYNFAFFRQQIWYRLPASRFLIIQCSLTLLTYMTAVALGDSNSWVPVGLFIASATLHFGIFLCFAFYVVRLLSRTYLTRQFQASIELLRTSHAALERSNYLASMISTSSNETTTTTTTTTTTKSTDVSSPPEATLSVDQVYFGLPSLPNSTSVYTVFVRVAPDPTSELTENLYIKMSTREIEYSSD